MVSIISNGEKKDVPFIGWIDSYRLRNSHRCILI